ncbi:uncharacterized protein EV154DRAFT_484132 [Mucor mucedo]|uniref:uncharacterized protein n=1 Tax=Mucor mucedo TaxID=29922 RepID=UPI00221F20B7|nr:uncharacterized protein EV154DRAFT_484132 [Mucor mucedo]KAI7888398.1 hypothetical protein EV154DRAFT_484132 [Mucor mucedo]
MTGFISKGLRYINPFSSLLKKGIQPMNNLRLLPLKQVVVSQLVLVVSQVLLLINQVVVWVSKVLVLVKKSGGIGGATLCGGVIAMVSPSGGISVVTPSGGISSQTSAIHSSKPSGGIVDEPSADSSGEPSGGSGDDHIHVINHSSDDEDPETENISFFRLS